MRPKLLDLILTSLVALFTLSVAFSDPQIVSGQNSFPSWFLPFGILMALLLPGYALTKGLLPDLDRSTTLLMSLGGSISLDILGALGLNLTRWGLQPISWAIWLSTVTLLGCLSGAVLRWQQPLAFEEQKSALRVNWRSAVSFISAGILIIMAIILSRSSANKPMTLFTQLWAFPVHGEDVDTIQIGLRNEENKVMEYRIYVETGGRRLADWDSVFVEPDHIWSNMIPLTELPAEPVRILLYKVGSPNEIYRQVQISPSSFVTSIVTQKPH